jgi:hypothetical protein
LEFIYKTENSQIFYKYWEEYIKNNLSSYKYTVLNLEYLLMYSTNLFLDSSFVIVENSKPVAIAFLPIAKIENNLLVSLAGGYTIAHLSTNERIEKVVFNENR